MLTYAGEGYALGNGSEEPSPVPIRVDAIRKFVIVQVSYVCWRMLTYAGVCWRMRMLAYAYAEVRVESIRNFRHYETSEVSGGGIRVAYARRRVLET